ncbi:MAG TPA: hypothetical protein VI299_27120 [Polyangiales bacterium]
MSDRTLRADVTRALLLYAATRACITVFVWLTGQHFAAITPGLDRQFFPDNMLLNGLFQWDAFQYSRLATRGYYQGEGYDVTLPFFPGFPLLARLVGKLFGSHLAGGIVVNQLATVGGAVLIARLSRALRLGAEQSEAVAQETTLFWLASPLTFYFCIFQTEALFAFASALTLWAVVVGRWYVALVAGILATATRNTGMVVVFAAALLAWERREQVKVGTVGWSCIALMPLGMVGLIVYQWFTLHDGFLWVTSQRLWNRYLTWPWSTIRDEWVGWPGLSPATRSVRAMHKVQELLALGILIPVFFARARLRLPWALLVLGVLEWVMPLASHSLLSSARYQAGNLYFALAIPALIAVHPMLRGVMWVASGMVLAWFASTWPYGFWCS